MGAAEPQAEPPPHHPCLTSTSLWVFNCSSRTRNRKILRFISILLTSLRSVSSIHINLAKPGQLACFVLMTIFFFIRINPTEGGSL